MRYLVWSLAHCGWWKQSRHGYTSVTHRAGRFTWDEARTIVQDANAHCAEGEPEEVMVLAPDQAQMDVDLAQD